MTVLESRNPATGEVVGTVALTPPSEVPEVVARARAAQAVWAAESLASRAQVLARAGQILSDRAESLGRLMTQEMGKPVAEATGEVRHTAASFGPALEGMVRALSPEVRESERVRSTIYHDPFGVAACISPWNFPVLMPHQQILPALAAGNAVVFKPSEKTPLVGQGYAAALREVLPDGVLEVVHGAEEQGKALVAADVDLVVFTGSREAGKHILRAASAGLRRVILELGGKDPLIVLDDADVAAAAKFAARNSFRNAGQVCVSTERIYVTPKVRAAFLEALVENTRAMTVGDGLDEGVTIGPMVDESQRRAVEVQVGRAVEEGAEVVFRGQAPEGPCFYPPVILRKVRPEMDIARDETFGPVVSVFDVADDEEAVAQANDTPFGLGAVVFGAPEHARRVARRLGAGMIGVNQGLASAGDTPWVGARESGYGFHSGPSGHRQFAQVRVLNEPQPGRVPR